MILLIITSDLGATQYSKMTNVTPPGVGGPCEIEGVHTLISLRGLPRTCCQKQFSLICLPESLHVLGRDPENSPPPYSLLLTPYSLFFCAYKALFWSFLLRKTVLLWFLSVKSAVNKESLFCLPAYSYAGHPRWPSGRRPQASQILVSRKPLPSPHRLAKKNPRNQ